MKRKNKDKIKARARDTVKQGHASLVSTQVEGKDELYISISGGRYSTVSRVGLKLAHEELVGGIEDANEMGAIVVKIGILAASALIGYNLANGVEGLAKAFAEWAGVDVDALNEAVNRDSEARLATQVEVANQLIKEQEEQDTALADAVEAEATTDVYTYEESVSGAI